MTDLLKQTDRCVKCGLCLPHCPTYRKTQDEGESPRGRVALIEGLANGQLALSPRLEAHLSSCLGCRACENVCPSEVPYGEIIDAGLALVEQQRHAKSHRLRLMDVFITHKSRLRLASQVLRFYQDSGLRSLARASGLLKLTGLAPLDALLPPLPPAPAWQAYYPPQGEQRGTVALFTGCVAEVMDTTTLNATIQLLGACGYAVHVPRAQVCCGALHQHNGAPQQAQQLARQNLAAFSALKVDTIISSASGCGAQLTEYHKIINDNGNAPNFATHVHDISEFLARITWPENIRFAPLDTRVAVHDPCSLRNVLHQQTHPYTLLRKIPGIDLIELPGNTQCCGAAGTNMITHPALASALRNDKLAALDNSGAQILVTSNIGCALHMLAGLRERSKNIEVLHPVTLLARQLQIAK